MSSDSIFSRKLIFRPLVSFTGRALDAIILCREMGLSDQKARGRRKKIIEYASIIIIIAAMVALYFVGRNRQGAEEEFSAKSGLELEGKFFASRFESGKLGFSISGKNFQYYPESGGAELREPVIQINSASQPVTVTGRSAKYFNDAKRIEIKDQVVIITANYKAETPALSYDAAHRVCTSPEQIRVTGNGLELTGRGYIFDLSKGHIEILSEVKSVFKEQG
jgi:LPS export ABC transporter protein LptC